MLAIGFSTRFKTFMSNKLKMCQELMIHDYLNNIYGSNSNKFIPFSHQMPHYLLQHEQVDFIWQP
jgi:hypothetical protein